MDVNKLRARWAETLEEIERFKEEQAALPHMPAPDHLPAIGAYADDDPETHRVGGEAAPWE